MKKLIDLSRQPWTLAGCNPNFHLLKKSWEIPEPEVLFIDPVPARVPGSVQQALKDAGIIPDWNFGRNATACEWVENRDWVFATRIQTDGLAGSQVVLHCEGLDYAGIIKLNKTVVGEFADAHIPHRFDLTPHISAAGDDLLEVVFQAKNLPRWLGQVCHTSQIREQKPRFYYTWDWVPRLVQIGIWDNIFLEVSHRPVIQSFQFYSEFDPAQQTGRLWFKGRVDSAPGCQLRLSLWDENKKLNTETFSVAEWKQAAWSATRACPVTAWWPNLCGPQKVYDVKVELLDEHGAIVDQLARKTGFRQIRWKACAAANPAADPWLCEINGQDTFLCGVNWTPIRPNFADVTTAECRSRIEAYRDLGFNTLRIWGGAVLERDAFYALCDELGMLVWQDFTLSSSGLDNHPPADPALVEVYARQARSIMARRQSHPSLLLWCGGNELYETGVDANGLVKGFPLTTSHPMLSRFEELVAAEDPARRFVPSTASGPLATATLEELGHGRAWDVHGPWNMVGDESTTKEYWDKDDALFRSETGFPGAMDAALIRKYAGVLPVLPVAKNVEIYKVCAWWLAGAAFNQEHGREPSTLEEYCDWSQRRQRKWLLYALQSARQRFPKIGGMIFWMGHDCFPCPVNTSLIDFEGRPKAAALGLGRWLKTLSPHEVLSPTENPARSKAHNGAVTSAAGIFSEV